MKEDFKAFDYSEYCEDLKCPAYSNIVQSLLNT